MFSLPLGVCLDVNKAVTKFGPLTTKLRTGETKCPWISWSWVWMRPSFLLNPFKCHLDWLEYNIMRIQLASEVIYSHIPSTHATLSSCLRGSRWVSQWPSTHPLSPLPPLCTPCHSRISCKESSSLLKWSKYLHSLNIIFFNFSLLNGLYSSLRSRMSCNVMSCHVTSCTVMWFHVMYPVMS
jgi:hypothetical protein